MVDLNLVLNKYIELLNCQSEYEKAKDELNCLEQENRNIVFDSTKSSPIKRLKELDELKDYYEQTMAEYVKYICPDFQYDFGKKQIFYNLLNDGRHKYALFTQVRTIKINLFGEDVEVFVDVDSPKNSIVIDPENLGGEGWRDFYREFKNRRGFSEDIQNDSEFVQGIIDSCKEEFEWEEKKYIENRAISAELEKNIARLKKETARKIPDNWFSRTFFSRAKKAIEKKEDDLIFEEMKYEDIIKKLRKSLEKQLRLKEYTSDATNSRLKVVNDIKLAFFIDSKIEEIENMFKRLKTEYKQQEADLNKKYEKTNDFEPENFSELKNALLLMKTDFDKKKQEFDSFYSGVMSDPEYAMQIENLNASEYPEAYLTVIEQMKKDLQLNKQNEKA